VSWLAACTSRQPRALELVPTAHFTSCLTRLRLDERLRGSVALVDGTSAAARLTAAAVPGGRVVGKASDTAGQLMDFRWQLAVGDDTLHEEEIAALAQAKAPLVGCVASGLRSTRPAQARLEFLAGERSSQATAARSCGWRRAILMISHAAAAGPGHADGWWESSSAEPCRIGAACASPAIYCQLRPYQERGLSWLTFLSRGARCVPGRRHGARKTVQLLPWRWRTALKTPQAAQRCCCARCRS